MTMITEDQKTQIANQVRIFQDKVAEYCATKERLDEYQANIEKKTNELLNITEPERQIETAVDVLYLQTRKVSRIKDIEIELNDLKGTINENQDKLNKLEADLLVSMRNLPLPIDLEKIEIKDSQAVFSYFTELELGEEVVNAISTIIRQKPLVFDEVAILPDKVAIDHVSDKQEAIKKLVEAIQNFRMRVSDLSQSYEKIDALIERLTSSKVYANILVTLAGKKPLSVQEISRNLNIDERAAYDGCYNLTRSNWSPSPIRKTPSGEYTITLTGEILAKRLLEKHPELNIRKEQLESVK